MSSVNEKLQRKSPSVDRPLNLRLEHVSVWSACKVSFIAGIGLGLLGGLATILIWAILTRAGVFANVEKLFSSGPTTGSSGLTNVFGIGQTFGIATLIAILDTVGFTLVGTLAALIYNAFVKLVGGAVMGFKAR
jgi:hypothetical protein